MDDDMMCEQELSQDELNSFLLLSDTATALHVQCLTRVRTRAVCQKLFFFALSRLCA